MFKPFDIEKFSSLESPLSKCSFIWDHYISRKRLDDYEPSWALSPYSTVKKAIDNKDNLEVLTERDYFLINETIKSHLQKDGTEVPIRTGFPNEGSRIMHDCWKAGSFTWIFMGRIECQAFLHGNYAVISRRLPDDMYDLLDKDYAPQTLFAAYDRLDESKNIGPAVTLEYLLREIDKEDRNVQI